MAFLYSLLILSTMFQDLPLKNYIGEYGASPSGFLAIAVFLFLVFYKKIYSTQFLTKFFYLVLYTVVATFVAFFIYMIIYRNGYYYGEQVLLKALKVIVYMASNYVYAISVFSIAATLKRRQVFGPFVWCLFITVFVAWVEMY